MFNIASLTYCGFNFDENADWSRKGMELALQQRNQALRPGIDYLFQPMQTGFQLSGMTPIGARAVSILAQAHRIQPNRLDLTLTVGDSQFNELVDYSFVVKRLVSWFRNNRPKLNISHMLPETGDRKILFGSKNSRWCLWVAERMISGGKPFSEVLEITWTVRNANCDAAWQFFDLAGSDSEFEFMAREAFAATTNTILGKDFFEFGHDVKVYLNKEKPGSEAKDWHSYLKTVARKLYAHCDSNEGSSLESDMIFLQCEIDGLFARSLKKD